MTAARGAGGLLCSRPRRLVQRSTVTIAVTADNDQKEHVLMRLYPIGAPQPVIDHPAWGRREAREDGGFDLPDELSDELHSFCHRGKRIWETEDERSERHQREGLAHRRDPAALFETVSGMSDLTRQLAAVQLGQSAPAPLDPEDEIAALRRRLAELEGSTPDGAGEAASGTHEKAAPKSPARTPAKDKPAPARAAENKAAD